MIVSGEFLRRSDEHPLRFLPPARIETARVGVW